MKIVFYRSYFAFTLASEQHQFYMRLRNSYISLKNVSDELNIPITTTKTLKESKEVKQTIPEEFQMFMLNDNDDKNQKTNSSEMFICENLKGIDKKSEANPYNGANETEKGIGSTGTTVLPLVRVKNTKKSMLNDNRLLKFKEKFLRRSKSTVGFAVDSIDLAGSVQPMVTAGGKQDKKVKDKTFKKLIESAWSTKNYIGGNSNTASTSNTASISTTATTNNNKTSKEENQNKENENPKNCLEIKARLPPSPSKSHGPAESENSDEHLKVHSPNRNRVKMGTRVFSSQILNKSFDNIFDRFINVQQFDTVSTVADGIGGEEGGYASIDYDCQIKGHRTEFKLNGKQFDTEDDNNSSKDISLSSLYCSTATDRNCSGNKFSPSVAPSPFQNGGAYIIREYYQNSNEKFCFIYYFNAMG